MVLVRDFPTVAVLRSPIVSRSRLSGFSANSFALPQRNNPYANATSWPASTSSSRSSKVARLRSHSKNGCQQSR
jgi:hypothetical protein